ncbi:MAG: PA0069 family radical SAM protein [Gammaproteobacteria bacterium]|nr:PA0069 family radical SAM protein [Gammaproteobacteria bacterium]
MDAKRVFKGRGAVSNPAGRFETAPSVAVHDGWDRSEDEDFPNPDPATSFLPDKTRNIIATNNSPDIPFEQSINPYKGCEHGCVYCYARPTHAFLDLSPGLDFETKIFYKTDPVDRLLEALDKPGYVCRTLAIGTNTDPYQPGEKALQVTRRVLETLLRCRHPVSIVTKGALILRDLDILRELAGLSLVSVGISITTLDNELKTKLEPRTASPGARLRVVRELKAADVPVGVMLAPVIPFINDHEIETIVARSAEAGAEFIGYVMLRLPFEVKDLFVEWLQEHYPFKAEHVMSRVREMRGGKAYQAEWGTRMRGEGVYADLVAKRFEVARRKHGLDTSRRAALRTDLFRPGQGMLF